MTYFANCCTLDELKLCSVERCPLYPFRFGKNPNRAGIGNPNAKSPNSTSELPKNSLSEGTYIPRDIPGENITTEVINQ